MASAKGQYHVGGARPLFGARASPVTQELNSSGDKIGAVFIAPDGTQALTHIDVYCTAITGSAPTMRVMIQGYNATGGIPDGADSGGGSPTLVAFTPVAGTLHHLALTNAFTPTEGVAYAAVLEYASGTIDASNNSTFIRSTQDTLSGILPYCVTDTAGTWDKVAGAHPCITPLYNDGLIVHGCEILTAATTPGFNSGSTPDEIGNVWVPDDSATCIGAQGLGRFNIAAANWEVRLYNSADSVIASVAVDGESVADTSVDRWWTVFWEGVAVTGGSTYRPVLLPTTGSGIQMNNQTFPNSAHRASYAGASLLKTERTNAGSWTNTAAQLRAIWPVLSGIAAGGGGLLVHPGTSGGARG